MRLCFLELIAVPMGELDVFGLVFADRFGVRDGGELLRDHNVVSAAAVERDELNDLTSREDIAAFVVFSAAILTAGQAINGVAVVKLAANIVN